MRNFAGLIAVVASLLALPALAVETGTPAWTIHDLTVYEGPGLEYDVVGDVSGDLQLRVDRCTYRWCRILTGSLSGWVSRDALSFGRHPRGPFTGPRLDYKYGGPGLACLYEGPNYSGDYVCLPSGTYRRDLLLYDADNRYSSVAIEGNVSITVCRDRDYSSYCERINASEPRLPVLLDNSVSSFRIH